ncbi:MAG: PLP-dependent aminotransferase family protein [Rhodocyclaceae bacterium]|nr:PLP-dependent aminotransferase family protein [Rhodocyclaceae bacterium]
MSDFLYDRLADEFAGLIAARVLQPGERLPSVRRLAMQKRLSVSTVLQALRQLEDRGLVEARPQAGFYVRRRGRAPAEPAVRGKLTRPTFVGVNQLLMQVLHANEQPGVLPLGAAHPGPGLLPSLRMQRMFAKVARGRADLLAVGSCVRGNDARLVRQIVRRSVDCGGPLAADEIIVTNSCTEALNLCLRAVAGPGDTIALESPTYFVLLQIIESLGMKALEIPTHPRSGVSVEALELATRGGAVKACLLIPNVNNPLGCIMPEENKRAVARLLAERNVPLIEDDVYGDLHFEGARPWPIKAYDTSGNVMLCSSFSKTVSPALLVGYIAAGRFHAEVALLKTLASGVTGAVPQAALAEFIEGGGFDRQVRHARRAYARQVARMSDAVAEHFPADCLLSRPQGGFVLWVEMPRQVDALELHREAVAAGIAFTPGQLFSASGRYRNCLRLNCGNPWDARFDAALRRLGELVRARL